ncbi:hypothetical protein LINPERPRIM_LOCUS22618 [Linum perenne]
MICGQHSNGSPPTLEAMVMKIGLMNLSISGRSTWQKTVSA